MPDSVGILILLWLINFAPPLTACLFEHRWKEPIDRGWTFRDGRPLFGTHKTTRGVVAGVLTGMAAGVVLGFSWWTGLLAGLLSMLGDLGSSFIKRRLDLPAGSLVPGLDQFLEGLLPFLVLGPYCQLSAGRVLLLVFLFGMGAYFGARLFYRFLMMKPFERYPRHIRPGVRLREIRSCHVQSFALRHLLNIENSLCYHVIMGPVFRLLGVYDKGKHNALRIRRHDVVLQFKDLPPAFDQYTILFVSDLHLDGLDGLTDNLRSLVREIPVDLCIIGGDLRMEKHGPFEETLQHLYNLIPDIRARDGIFGVLGNHDCPEIVEPLEKVGLKFLVNDAAAIERNSDRIWIVGVDDPHYFRCHDLDQAFEDVPPDAFSILVAHSNEIYREALEYHPRLYLCGHTHAGQIEIPFIGPVITHSKAPRRLCRGVWRHGEMLGYTTCGVGVSGVPVRFASSGEIAVITLQRIE